MEPFQTILGIKLAHLVAGFFGGLVRAIIHPDRSVTYTIGATIVGALFSGYMTPVAMPLVDRYLGYSDPSVGGSVGFMLGLCGLAISDGVVKLAKRWRDNPTIPRVK
ncbi:hypothetical protein [Cohaesibacter celericrescens]|uniref:Uncharacterized protein n=1 Tax=Cohaesibacter celericrescens TaxID=2067669 RepID=A0A2N5XX19_9HYPH|nr:hypothetical protein [Cohaesibacter celericrescens]PLW79056.1 hypothetical protein C0081_02160 [Cohaesibacter celericrescens]